ncbi:MAG: C-terminal domain of CinA type S, partial [uncultured Nocardioides sp.]
GRGPRRGAGRPARHGRAHRGDGRVPHGRAARGDPHRRARCLPCLPGRRGGLRDGGEARAPRRPGGPARRARRRVRGVRWCHGLRGPRPPRGVVRRVHHRCRRPRPAGGPPGRDRVDRRRRRRDARHQAPPPDRRPGPRAPSHLLGCDQPDRRRPASGSSTPRV